MSGTPEEMEEIHIEQKIEEIISYLEYLADNSELLARLSDIQRVALLTAAGRLSRPTREQINLRRKERNKLRRQQVMEKDRSLRAATGIRVARNTDVYKAPPQLAIIGSAGTSEKKRLSTPRNCYVCKAEYRELHFFYDSMCKTCGDFNYQKRFQKADLSGKVALITGSRLKIGYHAALMMLRAGAEVIATTRFPVDAAMRFSKEKDFKEWRENIHIYGLDLRHTPSVELFASHVEKKYPRLDILINNAAQTVRRPPGFYSHLMKNEMKDVFTLPVHVQSLIGNYESLRSDLNAISIHHTSSENRLPVSFTDNVPGIGIRASAELSQIAYGEDLTLSNRDIFPDNKMDMDLQQIDLRKTNSWRLRIGEIPTHEMLEVQLVNAVAPFVLCNRLIPFMKLDYTGEKHIVNVTAMEGKFHRFKQASRHPHTNMAKAALNMLTHTAAADLAKEGIFINAVDTGWVTDEDPAMLAALKEKTHDFQPPLDIVDGAARVCDPFFDGILTGNHWKGKFLKDYKPIDW